ncbi:hypothetical protein COU76_03785 [Candidatus Peregrinibacteria bacterium CG10_big_fil_rev_8_21_14_0_10_49_10]|nr:MAG: hypothetical protein COU76_03785 [Candidatus Peregrinibacteria bacterium CG10_big_fil_rev_8_21_14_0_10_49_10]
MHVLYERIVGERGLFGQPEAQKLFQVLRFSSGLVCSFPFGLAMILSRVTASFHQRRLHNASRKRRGLCSFFRRKSTRSGCDTSQKHHARGIPARIVTGVSFGLRTLFSRMLTALHNRPTSRNAWLVLGAKCCSIFGGLAILYVAFLWFTLPNISDPRSLLASQSTVIVDRNGVELYRLFSEQDRTYIPADRIPDYLEDAIIAIEDERFYERGCLDLRAIARVVFMFGRAGGGSTLTRQLARNALDLKKENIYNRKIKEFMLGCQMEHRFSKDDLLELYLNWIPFGRNAYGVEQASQTYFGIPAEELTLAQSVVLASLPQRPSYYSPYGTHLHTEVSDTVLQGVLKGTITRASDIPDDGVYIGLLGANIGTGSVSLYVGGRTDQVLRNMKEQGFISEQELLAAQAELEHVTFQPSRENIRAPHFVLWIRDQIEKLFAGSAEQGLVEQGGLRIETTLDWDLQQIAEETVAFHQEDILNRYGARNMALISVDRHTREVLAYVGNMDYADTEHGGKIDMAQSPRQPGSSFKPFVYAAAFQRGYTPGTVLYDVPTVIGEDEPQNFDGKFMGPLTIRYALGASRNIPAAKAFFLAGGEDAILALVSNMGAPSPHKRRQELADARPEGFDYGWPLALGAAETPLIEMVHAYSTFAADGVYKPLLSIKRITDKHGNLLYEPEQEEKEVMDPRIAYQITSILSDELARPEDYWRTQLTVPGYQTAAKTGTSNKCLERDEKTGDCKLLKPDNAWTIGYTPDLVTGVWAGNADSSAMYDKGGGLNTASPIWRDYMIRAHRRLANPEKTFAVPEGIVRPIISLLSGQLPTACTPIHLRRSDVFLREQAPSQPDPACKQLTVDKVTRLLASESCPQEARESGSFLVAGSILPARWPDWEKGVQEWVTTQMALWYATDNHSGSILPLPVAPMQQCDISLTPGRLVKPTLSITSPAEGQVVNYPAFLPHMKYSVGSLVREVSYEVDGKPLRTVGVEPFFSTTVRVPRTVEKYGLHTLRITLTDEYFNTVSDSVRFRFTPETPGRFDRIESSRSALPEASVSSTLPEETADPVLLSPVSLSTVSFGDIVDIQVHTPDVSALVSSNLSLFVLSETGEEDNLFNITEGEGTYTRQWKARKTGMFTLILRSEGRDSSVREWGKVGPFEVR